MEYFLISTYTAACIAVFTLFRIPVNRYTLPSASIGGLVMIIALIQLLNFYHPYTDTSRQYLLSAQNLPVMDEDSAPIDVEEQKLIAWFAPNSLLRLDDGSAAEVTFDSIPGRVFSGRLQSRLPAAGGDLAWIEGFFDAVPGPQEQPRIPVLIDITDPQYSVYESRLAEGSVARAAVYGDRLQQLALLRKTLMRMSAWVNYLSPVT